jgi:hypothetical protein
MKILAVSPSDLFRSPAVAALILMVGCPAFSKRKDDVVIMANGDRFTGEIKGVQYGELIFKSDYMKDSVHLDWKRVTVLESKDTYIVALSDGQRITGLIKRARVDGGNQQEFTVSSKDSALEVSPQDVIRIGQREASFWNQLTGSVDYGFGFASDNHSTNSSLAAEVAFQTTNNSISLATVPNLTHRRMPRTRTGSPSITVRKEYNDKLACRRTFYRAQEQSAGSGITYNLWWRICKTARPD